MHEQFDVEIDHKHRNWLQIVDGVIYACNVTITVMARHFEVIINTFTISGIFKARTGTFIVFVLSSPV
jgi:hypothetical protein